MRLFILLFSAAAFVGCSQPDPVASPAPEKLIAISWFYPNNAYQNWLSSYDSELTFVNIYDTPDDSIDFYLDLASGYVLSGGCDLHPSLYGEPEQVSRCGALDSRRDSLELLMVQESFRQKTPLLGVCRGLQIMNVAKGGSLIIDLPTDRNTTIHQQDEGDALHYVYLVSDSRLSTFSSKDSILVNSNHHQGIDQLAQGYDVMAYAPDSTIEAIAWGNDEQHPYAVAVQWHPERMDAQNPLSSKLAEDLLEAIELYFASETDSR